MVSDEEFKQLKEDFRIFKFEFENRLKEAEDDARNALRNMHSECEVSWGDFADLRDEVRKLKR